MMRCRLLCVFWCSLALAWSQDTLPAPDWGTEAWRAPYRDSVGDAIGRFSNQVRDIAKAPVPKEPVVFVGSSSVRAWRSLEEDFPNFPVSNSGFGGSTLPELSFYLKELVLDKKPSMVVVYCGENDLTLAYSRPQEVFGSFLELAGLLKQALKKGTPVVFLSVKPSIYSWNYWEKQQQFNRMVELFDAWVDWPEFQFVRMGHLLLNDAGEPDPALFIRDGLHLNKSGYQKWTMFLRPKLERMYKELQGPDGAK